MSMQEFESRTRRPTPVGGRDLAAAWLTAAVAIVALGLLQGLHGAPRSEDPALAGIVTHGDCLVPDGIGEAHESIQACSTRDWADERC
ncbi:MAG TPA: hypothetical protein VMG55_19055 [Stellaceae bacterium]|nr:hypothetical protein [Stellaceae bacterium]